MSRRPLAIAALAASMSWGWAMAQPIPVAPGVDLSIAPNVDPSTGQTSYNVKNMDFDLWCQQTQRYDISRCEARRAEDVKAFEDYRTAVERYELDFLKQQQRDNEFRAQTSRDPLQNAQSKQDGLP
jgi:hypothetical protein